MIFPFSGNLSKWCGFLNALYTTLCSLNITHLIYVDWGNHYDPWLQDATYTSTLCILSFVLSIVSCKVSFQLESTTGEVLLGHRRGDLFRYMRTNVNKMTTVKRAHTHIPDQYQTITYDLPFVLACMHCAQILMPVYTTTKEAMVFVQSLWSGPRIVI